MVKGVMMLVGIQLVYHHFRDDQLTISWSPICSVRYRAYE